MASLDIKTQTQDFTVGDSSNTDSDEKIIIFYYTKNNEGKIYVEYILSSDYYKQTA